MRLEYGGNGEPVYAAGQALMTRIGRIRGGINRFSKQIEPQLVPNSIRDRQIEKIWNRFVMRDSIMFLMSGK